jgi:hypothetical protein
VVEDAAHDFLGDVAVDPPACRTVAAAGDRAPLVRLLTPQTRIGVCSELVEVRAA